MKEGILHLTLQKGFQLNAMTNYKPINQINYMKWTNFQTHNKLLKIT